MAAHNDGTHWPEDPLFLPPPPPLAWSSDPEHYLNRILKTIANTEDLNTIQIMIVREVVIACREKLRSRAIKCRKELATPPNLVLIETENAEVPKLSELRSARTGKTPEDSLTAFFKKLGDFDVALHTSPMQVKKPLGLSQQACCLIGTALVLFLIIRDKVSNSIRYAKSSGKASNSFFKNPRTRGRCMENMKSDEESLFCGTPREISLPRGQDSPLVFTVIGWICELTMNDRSALHGPESSHCRGT